MSSPVSNDAVEQEVPRKRGGTGRGRRPRRGGYIRGGKRVPTFDAVKEASSFSVSNNDFKSSESMSKFSPENLAALMDEEFPVTSHPVSVVQSVAIDVNSYVSISDECYRSLIYEDQKCKNALSYSEFMLVMGWLLVKRVLEVRHEYFSEESFCQRFGEVFPPDVLVPGPIAMALDSLGVVKTQGGATLVPEVILPQFNFADEIKQGMLPSYYTSGFQEPAIGAVYSMFPFGLYRRRLLQRYGDPKRYGDAWNQLDPTVESKDRSNPYLHANDLPGMAIMLDDDVRARDNYDANGSFAMSKDIFGSVSYNGTIMRSYLLFVDKVKKYMSFSKVTKSTSGSCALVGFVVANDENACTNAFSVYSSYALSKWEQHAVRLFKWRRYIEKRRDATGVGEATSFSRSPPSIRERTNEITPVISDSDHIRYYVSAFVVSKARVVL